MAKLFEFEWVDPGGARGPELRATWARLEVRVEDSIVTRVLDLKTKGVRDSVYVPLYPIAEWLAIHWWHLLFETESNRSTHKHYPTRHRLDSASEGFALPSLVFEPMGEVVRMFWNPKRLRHSRLEFVSSGSAHLDRGAVEDELCTFIEAVLGRLEEQGVENTVLHQEWQTIRELDVEEKKFCQTAAALGLDPYRVDPEQEQAILDVARDLPQALHDEFFYTADPMSLAEEAASVVEALETACVARPELADLHGLRESFSGRQNDMKLPWTQGYDAARELRRTLDLNGTPLGSFEAIGRALGVEEAALETEIFRQPGLVRVDGVIGFDDRQVPAFVVRPASEETRRFTFCRELFEYLTTTGPSPLIVTRAHTHRQRRNRAFAAEFLLPSEPLRQRITSEIVTDEDVNEIASEFGVSWIVVQHQLANHQIARISSD